MNWMKIGVSLFMLIVLVGTVLATVTITYVTPTPADNAESNTSSLRFRVQTNDTGYGATTLVFGDTNYSMSYTNQAGVYYYSRNLTNLNELAYDWYTVLTGNDSSVNRGATRTVVITDGGSNYGNILQARQAATGTKTGDGLSNTTIAAIVIIGGVAAYAAVSKKF